MEFVRLKYANNKLINADIKEHREIISEYVEKKGFEYIGFIPTAFGTNGRIMEVDLVFKKPVQARKPVLHSVKKPVEATNPVLRSQPASKIHQAEPVKHEIVKTKSDTNSLNDLYNDRGLDLILNGGGDDLIALLN